MGCEIVLAIEIAWELAPGDAHIRERHGGSAEHAILEGNAPVNIDVVLEFASISDDRPGIHEDVLPDIAVFAHDRAGSDMSVRPHVSSSPDHRSIFDRSSLMNRKTAVGIHSHLIKSDQLVAIRLLDIF